MPMYNLIEYSDNYAETSGSLWQYYRDGPNDNLGNSESFISKIKITGKTGRTLEIPLIDYEVSLILTWSLTCLITNSAGAGTFEITDTKLYVPVVTLSTQDNSKLRQQLKSDFIKGKIGTNIYQNQNYEEEIQM